MAELDKEYLETTLKLMEKKSQDIREIDAKKKKELFKLKYQLSTLERRYEEQYKPIINTGKALTDTITMLCGGKREFVKFLEDNKDFANRFKYAKLFFSDRRLGKEEEDEKADNPAKPA